MIIEELNGYTVKDVIASDTFRQVKLVMETKIIIGPKPMYTEEVRTSFKVYKNGLLITITNRAKTALLTYNQI